MYSINRLCLVLAALPASLVLAAPLPAGLRDSPQPLSRSRSPARTPPPATGTGPASPAPLFSASDVRTIIVKGVSYTLGKLLGAGQIGKVYSVPGGKVAKKLKLTGNNGPLYNGEVGYTVQVLGPKAVSSGESQINKTGEKFGWIITPRVPGEPFYENPVLQDKRAKGQRGECEKWITEKVQPEFIRKFIALQRNKLLVHLDPHLGNVFWDSKGEMITGFIDFDDMDTLGGIYYKERVKDLTGNEHLTLDQLAQYFADRYYNGVELCDPETTLSASSIVSSRRRSRRS